MNSSKQIKIGAALSYISIALNIIAGLIYTPWMIEQIGKSDYGLYTLANSLITLFLLDFGLSSATTRYMAKYRAEGNEEKAEKFLGAIYKLYILIDAVILTILIVIFLLIDTIYIKLTPAELEKLKIVYAISALYAVINFPFVTFNGILTAYEKFIPLKLADVIYRVLLVGLTVVALCMGYGLYSLVIVHAISGLIVILFKYCVIRKSIGVKVSFIKTEKSLYKEIFGFSVWVAIASVAQRLIFNITPSVLGMVAGTASIAVFGVITTLEGYTYTITSAINGMFLPRISKSYASGKDNLNPLLLKVGRFQYALNGLIITGFAVIGKEFIELWMGHDYIAAYYGVLLVTIPGLFFNSLQISNTAMIVQNKVKLQAYITVATGVINIVLSFVLSALYGVSGASISIFVAYMFRAIVTNLVSYKIMGFDIPTFAKECYLKMSVPAALTIAIGFVLNSFIRESSWMILIIKGIVVSAVYFVMIFLIGLQKDEKQKITSMTHTIMKRRA